MTMSAVDPALALRQWLTRTAKFVAPRPSTADADNWFSSRDVETVAVQLKVPYMRVIGWHNGRTKPNAEQAAALEALGGPPASLWQLGEPVLPTRGHVQLRRWMLALGYSPATLGETIGATAAAIEGWLVGTGAPTEALMKRLARLGGPTIAMWLTPLDDAARVVNEPVEEVRQVKDDGRVPLQIPDAWLATKADAADRKLLAGRCQCLSHRIERAATDYEQLPWQSRRYIIRTTYELSAGACCEERARVRGPVEIRDVGILMTGQRPAGMNLGQWVDHAAWERICLNDG